MLVVGWSTAELRVLLSDLILYQQQQWEHAVHRVSLSANVLAMKKEPGAYRISALYSIDLLPKVIHFTETRFLCQTVYVEIA